MLQCGPVSKQKYAPRLCCSECWPTYKKCLGKLSSRLFTLFSRLCSTLSCSKVLENRCDKMTELQYFPLITKYTRKIMDVLLECIQVVSAPYILVKFYFIFLCISELCLCKHLLVSVLAEHCKVITLIYLLSYRMTVKRIDCYNKMFCTVHKLCNVNDH